MSENFVTAVLVCAGNSTRMGLDVSKQLIPILGKPAIEYTLTAFTRSTLTDEIVIVCRESDAEQIKNIVADGNFTKVKRIVNGGSTRSESVQNGVNVCSENTTHIAVHDGARILITADDIDKVIRCGILNKAAALGVPVTDTIKTVDEKGFITSTPKRSELVAIQTPQVFEKNLYLGACKNMSQLGEEITDDCMIVEKNGVRVLVVTGNVDNIKLTVSRDIDYAEMIIKKDRLVQSKKDSKGNLL